MLTEKRRHAHDRCERNAHVMRKNTRNLNEVSEKRVSNKGLEDDQ